MLPLINASCSALEEQLENCFMPFDWILNMYTFTNFHYFIHFTYFSQMVIILNQMYTLLEFRFITNNNETKIF